MPKNIKLDRCEEFIYGIISSRIRTLKKHCEMKNYEIIPTDAQLASYILNNKRSKKKNPYLITATYFEEIYQNLKFKSQNEMLWGNEKEFKAFGGHFFFLLIDEILSVQSPEVELEQLQKCIIWFLNDYAPFAKISCCEDFKCKQKTIDEYFFNLINPHLTIDDSEKVTIRKNAIGRLYYILENQFIKSFLSFFENKNTIKLNKKLNIYILNDFSEILQTQRANTPYSIGTLVYDSLKAYYELTPSETQLYFHELGGYHNTLTPETQEDLGDVLTCLRNTNSSYIDKLIELQTRLEYTSYEDYLVNNWDYHNFL